MIVLVLVAVLVLEAPGLKIEDDYEDEDDHEDGFGELARMRD